MAKLETFPQKAERHDLTVITTVPATMVDLSGVTVPRDPWRRRSVATVVACNAVAFVVILLGWFEASASAVVRRQLPWLNVGICGLAVATIGNSLWLRQRRRALIGLVDGGNDLWNWIARSTSSAVPSASESGEIRLDGGDGGGVLVSAPRMTLFHRPDCPFVAGKPVTHQLRSAHVAAGRSACAVCEP